MRSSTSSEGPRLVRFAVPCAQTRVTIEMHSRMNGTGSAVRFERPAQQITEPQAKREMRSVLCHSLVVDSTERGRHHCSGEFEQLLLTCIEGCGLRSNTNRFKVCAPEASMRTVLTMDIRTATFSEYVSLSNSCIFHDCDIKHTCYNVMLYGYGSHAMFSLLST